MKKLLVVLVMCGAASVAFGAVGAFSLPAETTIEPGQSAQVMVSVNSPGATDALVLFAQTTGVFEVTGLNLTTGTVFDGNNRFLTIDLYDPHIGYGSVSTQAGTVNVAPGSAVAFVTVTAKADAPIGSVGTISTESVDGGSELGFANPGIGQATGSLRVVPEPASALLLLGALPLIRRRR